MIEERSDIMSTQFSFCTKHSYQNNYSIQSHTHPCYELVYYLEGEGTTTIGETQYSFRPNTFIVTAPNEIHKESSDGSVSVKFIGFTTDSEQLKSGIYTDSNRTILEVIEEIQKELDLKQPQYQTMLNLLAKKIIIHVLRLSPEHYYSKTSFEYIENYIKMNANKNTTIQEIAKNLNYNYDYLRQLFLSRLHISAKKYFLGFKLQNTKNYLLNSDLTIKQIADITGFSSSSHLCAAFKQNFGITPQQYRKQRDEQKFRTNPHSFIDEEVPKE